jgi:hydroxymethylpyrimidine/phosphomethylpyrimidine kinase
MSSPARILTIAGSDCSGGAGLQADLKTIIMLGGYGMSAITAITAQNTTGVFAVEALSAQMVGAQVDACVDDIGVDAVKIGMLGSAAIAHAVADRLEKLGVPVVFDPVMIATSGGVLADDATRAAFGRLMALHADHAQCARTGRAGRGRGAGGAGHRLPRQGRRCRGPVVEDRLFLPGATPVVWHAERIETRHTHGTGCSLASAIATGLGQGLDLVAAVERGRAFVRQALLAAPGLGAGHGPLGHEAVKGFKKDNARAPSERLSRATSWAPSRSLYCRRCASSSAMRPDCRAAGFKTQKAPRLPACGAFVQVERSIARIGRHHPGVGRRSGSARVTPRIFLLQSSTGFDSMP